VVIFPPTSLFVFRRRLAAPRDEGSTAWPRDEGLWCPLSTKGGELRVSIGALQSGVGNHLFGEHRSGTLDSRDFERYIMYSVVTQRYLAAVACQLTAENIPCCERDRRSPSCMRYHPDDRALRKNAFGRHVQFGSCICGVAQLVVDSPN
jgi:hypothetical protein